MKENEPNPMVFSCHGPLQTLPAQIMGQGILDVLREVLEGERGPLHVGQPHRVLRSCVTVVLPAGPRGWPFFEFNRHYL